MRAFLEEYARLRVLEKEYKEIPEHRKEDYNILEKYRSEGMTFWKYLSTQKFYMTTVTYPGRWEKKNFSTFHWALYMTNNFCAEPQGNEGQEPITYQLVKCEERDEKDVAEFRDKWWKIAKDIKTSAHRSKSWFKYG